MMKLLKLDHKGQILVLLVAALFVLFMVAALALDLGRAYGIRARLNAAVDAASYEGTKALGQGNNEDQMKARAVQIATAYFRANYPEEYLGATPEDPEIIPQRDTKTGNWTVSVQATAKMPTMFALVMGWPTMNISASSEALRRTLDMVLVLDTSYSLLPVFGQVKASSQAFVNLFNEQEDRVGLVAFSDGAAPIVSICGETAALTSPPTPPPPPQNPAANSLSCDRGFQKGTATPPNGVLGAIDVLRTNLNTNGEEGMKKALDQLNSLRPGSRSSVRAIVFFSDGAPNTFYGTFSTTSGPVTGNLYAGATGDPAQWIYNPAVYNDNSSPTYTVLAPLPTSSADTANPVPVASYNGIRTLTGGGSTTALHCDANRAARNMVENVANMARSQGIYVYTLGYGPLLNALEVTDCGYTAAENGANIMRRLANTSDSDTYNKDQPTGVYCFAPTTAQLGPCFEKIASAVLRISK